jgi:hypothetical protein
MIKPHPGLYVPPYYLKNCARTLHNPLPRRYVVDKVNKACRWDDPTRATHEILHLINFYGEFSNRVPQPEISRIIVIQHDCFC